MRDLDVLSPGNSYDHCQTLQPNPRRAGLPRTVSEWRDLRREKHGQTQTTSTAEIENFSAFEEMRSSGNETLTGRRRSTRVQSKQTRINTRTRNTQPVLTLNPSSAPMTPTNGDSATPEADTPDLAEAKPQGSKKGVAPKAFLYALQEPPVVGKKILHIKNVIQIMDTTHMNKVQDKARHKTDNMPLKPRAAIICSKNLNMWPIAEFCSRDMAVGLLKGTNLGDVYIVSLYCDGEKGTKAVPQRKYRS